MDYRRASRIAEWSLLAAIGILHLAIFLTPEIRARPQLLVESAHDAQLLSGIVLILGWCVLGPGSVWLRLVALPVLVGLWLLPWNARMLPRQTSPAFPFIVAFTAAGAIGLARLFGLRARQLDPAPGPQRGPQFSLLGLLITTTLIAAAVGGLEALRPTIGGDRGSDMRLLLGEISSAPRQARELVLGVSVALSAIGGLWVVARPGAIWLRLAAVLTAIPILAGYLINLAGITEDRTTTAINLGLSLAWVAGLVGMTVWPLRLLGYRLMRRAPARAPAAANATSEPPAAARWAAVALVLALGATIPLAYWIGDRRLDRTSIPTATFASWIQPRPSRGAIWDRLMRIRIPVHSWSGPQPLPDPGPAETMLIELSNPWEYRNSAAAQPASGSEAPDGGFMPAQP